MSKSNPTILQQMKSGCIDSIPIVIGYIPACMTFGLIGKALSLGDLEVFLLSAVVYAGASQFIGAKLIAAGTAAPILLLLTFIINLRYFFISLSFTRKINDRFSPIQKGVVGFGLTEEVFAVSTMSRQNLERGMPLTASYMLGLELFPYVATLLATWSGIILADYIPSHLLPALNTSLYALLIALIIPQLRANRQNLVICCTAALASWLLQPYLGNATVLVAMAIGAWAGGFVPSKEEKMRSEVM